MNNGLSLTSTIQYCGDSPGAQILPNQQCPLVCMGVISHVQTLLEDDDSVLCVAVSLPVTEAVVTLVRAHDRLIVVE